MRLLIKILVGIVAIVVLAAGGLFAAYKIWWESDPEPRAELDRNRCTEGGDLTGAYTVDPGDPADPTFVGYRVTEQLAAAVVESEATGRTSDVSGSFTISGNTVTETTVTANLQTLKSDREMRDDRIKTLGLESDQFPEATFVLTEPIDLSAAATRNAVRATATGDFTLHGVTQPVEIPLDACRDRADPNIVQVVGNLPVEFADYDIDAPNIAGFVTVRDEGEMEFKIFFQKG